MEQGRILLGGHDLKDIPLRQLYEQTAFVSQDNYLFDETVRENIRMGRPGATDREVEAVAKAAGCDEFIRRLENGYDTVVGEGGAISPEGNGRGSPSHGPCLKNAPVVLP